MSTQTTVEVSVDDFTKSSEALLKENEGLYGLDSLFFNEYRDSHRVIMTDDDILTGALIADGFPAFTATGGEWSRGHNSYLRAAGKTEVLILSASNPGWASDIKREAFEGVEGITAHAFYLPDAERMTGKQVVKALLGKAKAKTTKASKNGQIAPLKPISMTDLLAMVFAPLVWLVENLIAKGYFVVLGGRPKSGKSWFILQLAKCIDLGEPFLGRATHKAKVLYVALEDGQRRVYQRSQQLKWQPRQAAVLFDCATFDSPDGLTGPGLIQVANLANDYDLIIIDTLAATRSGRVSENDNAAMGAIANELARIAHDTDTAIILVHHTGKAVSDDIFITLRGASALRGGYDVGLLLERLPDEKEGILHAESRDIDVENMTLRQAANGAGWEYVGGSFEIQKIRAGRETLKVMLENDPEGKGMIVEEIVKIRKVSNQAISKQLERLERDGYVYRVEQPSTTMGRRPDTWYVHEACR